MCLLPHHCQHTLIQLILTQGSRQRQYDVQTAAVERFADVATRDLTIQAPEDFAGEAENSREEYFL
jgi:hypothetical protein